MHALSQLTNYPANNTVLFDKRGFKVIDENNHIICSNSKGESEKLWFMPTFDTNKQPTDPSALYFASANIFIKDEPNAILVAYQSACFLNPPDSTFEKAVRKNWIKVRRLTGEIIAKNKPHSMGTAYGHLNRLRQNLRRSDEPSVKQNKTNNSTSTSTSTDKSTDDNNDDLIEGEHMEEMVVSLKNIKDLSPAEKKALAIYFDATGKFPFESEEGYQYMLVSVYKNYIHVEPVTDRNAKSYITAYRNTINFFRNKGHVLSIARLDNETSDLLENFLDSEAKVKYQFITAGSHRASKAERAIQSWKNHLIAGISTVDPDFPMNQWNKLITQAEITINHLRPYAGNISISAYEGILGEKYDFEAHPLAPIGIKVIIYEPADSRPSWNPHGIAGFYLGPALHHYRSMAVYIPDTKGIRISDQCEFFPTKFQFPGASKEEKLLKAVENLNNTLKLNPTINNDNLSDEVLNLSTATNKFNSSIIPSEPTSPDELPLVVEPDLADVNMQNDFNQISNIIPTKRVVYDKHHLRKEKSKPIENNFRPLTPKESKNTYFLTLKDRVGQHFIDTEDSIEFVIDSLVMLSIPKGPGSKTPHYRMYSISQHVRPTAVREYEYTRCSETSTAKYVSWTARGQSAFALSIRATLPRDKNRALNQTSNGQPLNFKKAKEIDPELWIKCDVEEWHRLLQNTARPIYRSEIPKGEVISYYSKQVKEKLIKVDDEEYIDARVRGTYGGDRCNYKGPTSCNTAEYPLIKTLLSATLHDVKFIDSDTRFVNIDATDFYIFTPLEEPAYMGVPVKEIPQEIVIEYDLMKRAHNGMVYFKIVQSMWGHPVAGRLANKHLFKTIEPEGYYEDNLVPCLLKHKTKPTIGAVVVDDIGLKVRCKEDVMHLVNAIEKVWKIKINWLGDKYVGMDLKWNYNPENPELDISSDIRVPDALKRFYPGQTLKGADTPGIETTGWTMNSNKEIITVEEPDPEPVPEKTKFVQELTGTSSHLGRVVRHDILPAVNDIAKTQAAPTTKTMAQVDRLSNYMARYPKGSLKFKATDMILRCHYDSSLRPHGRHKAGGVIYHANASDPPEKIGNIVDIICKTPPNAVASIAEGEYCSQLINGQTAYWHRVILEQMGYKQPPTVLYGDNTTAVGIANDSTKI